MTKAKTSSGLLHPNRSTQSHGQCGQIAALSLQAIYSFTEKSCQKEQQIDSWIILSSKLKTPDMNEFKFQFGVLTSLNVHCVIFKSFKTFCQELLIVIDHLVN